ncbi:MAG: enoyl-CoA hydratase/isomerase family protein [Salinicola sp.]|uniref:enoyl-CoA hydratase/isomerase family protein n=1 Tax=Salinicola sp. TaxID=1978524 RepID=UPI001DE490B2|nr:enoyl-CoA hydratase/isomerase family protein [Salinicola sp.]NRB54696.1 enoyl-CoA hydratase/isomerase family protein [Salinicola sp.]
MSEPVRFDTLATADGHRLGHITLDAPKSLNALSLAMIDAIQVQIDAWAEDPTVVALWLEGAGDKAFCAGGDVVALRRAIAEGHTGRDPEAADGFVARYFTHEYRLDHALHAYPKPIVAWGDGIVMGGGIGLMAGASHRVVTPRSMLAMPEITIGLYPDVGASWFLNRMPGASGTFLGLTGARLNASDALFVGLADRLIDAERRDAVIDDLLDADWSRPRPALERVLRAHAAASRELAPAAEVAPRQEAIAALTDADSDEALIDSIIAAGDSDDPWIARAARNLAAGSPLSARLILRQLTRCRRVSLAETLRSELDLSLACAAHGDLGEGVRALLIDKDNAPAWHHAHGAVAAADLDACLAPAWSRQTHPLRDLHDHVIG